MTLDNLPQTSYASLFERFSAPARSPFRRGLRALFSGSSFGAT